MDLAGLARELDAAGTHAADPFGLFRQREVHRVWAHVVLLHLAEDPFDFDHLVVRSLSCAGGRSAVCLYSFGSLRQEAQRGQYAAGSPMSVGTAAAVN